MNQTIIDPARIRRALDLDVQPTEDGWIVTGGWEGHVGSSELGKPWNRGAARNTLVQVDET